MTEEAQVASPAVGGDTPVQQAPVEGTTPPAPAVEAPQLTIQDLQNLRAVVDLSMRRGAFGAAEASSVGAVFDRLNTFLNAVAPADQAPDAQ
jgi:hypothetical protein